MKRWNKILAVFLPCLLILSLFAACMSSEPTLEGNEAVPPSVSQSSATTKDDPTPESETSSHQGNPEIVDPEDIVTIYVSYLDCFGMADHYKRIEERINSITEREIGVHVELLFWDFGSYVTNSTMRLAGGEQYDVMNVTPMLPFSSLYAQNQIMESREVLEQYAAEAMQILGQYAVAYEMDGGLYGLPNYRLYQTNTYICMLKDVLDEFNLTNDANNAASWSDVEAIFARVHEEDPSLIIIGGGKGVLQSHVLWMSDRFEDAIIPDTLGDPTGSCYAIDGKITNKWENEALVHTMERVNDWYNRGWVWIEAMQSTEELALMKAGKLFSKPLNTEVGGESNMRSQLERDVVHILTAENVVDTKVLNQMGVVIPITAEEPEAAAKFINLLYTNKEIVTLFAWGEEGTDFVLNEEGEACFPDSGVLYHEGDFMIGNQFLAPPWEGSGGDFRSVALAANADATISDYLGFSIDTTNLTNEIAAINAVTDEFLPRLFCGFYEPELYNQMINKLKSADIDSYLAAVQTQLDAWEAAR